MGYAEWLLGVLWAMLDPITFITIVLAFSVGLWRKEWWIPAIIALIADGASILVLYNHWRRLDIDIMSKAWQGALLFAIFTYSAYVLARLLVLIHSRVRQDG
jgi:hypothetical protein